MFLLRAYDLHLFINNSKVTSVIKEGEEELKENLAATATSATKHISMPKYRGEEIIKKIRLGVRKQNLDFLDLAISHLVYRGIVCMDGRYTCHSNHCPAMENASRLRS